MNIIADMSLNNIFYTLRYTSDIFGNGVRLFNPIHFTNSIFYINWKGEFNIFFLNTVEKFRCNSVSLTQQLIS